MAQILHLGQDMNPGEDHSIHETMSSSCFRWWPKGKNGWGWFVCMPRHLHQPVLILWPALPHNCYWRAKQGDRQFLCRKRKGIVALVAASHLLQSSTHLSLLPPPKCLYMMGSSSPNKHHGRGGIGTPNIVIQVKLLHHTGSWSKSNHYITLDPLHPLPLLHLPLLLRSASWVFFLGKTEVGLRKAEVGAEQLMIWSFTGEGGKVG